MKFNQLLKRGLLLSFFIFVLSNILVGSVAKTDTVYYRINMDEAVANEFAVQMELSVKDLNEPYLDIRMPVWSPGYYQVMDFGQHVKAFRVQADLKQDSLRWVKLDKDTWRIYTNGVHNITVSYKVHTPRAFVATSYIDTNRAFIKPAALFFYVDRQLDRPVRLDLDIFADWDRVATGLDSIAGKSFSFVAPDYDTLYDSPLLVGNLRELPPFFVNGIKHRFLGYNMGDFDEVTLMDELKLIVQASVDLMGGDIPYTHYTFIGIGPGQGGIEQLNSTAISFFTANGLEGERRMRTLSFIAHEYFHHYNVKRIRPIELGPFDYSKPNRTNLLWVAEGLTVYYENVILNQAGLMDAKETLRIWENQINNYENNRGKYKQSLAESSAQTWEDGPFGKPGETISYYVKGPIIGILLDLRIRAASHNQYSLDDVMRHLYSEFYVNHNRGFTDREVMDVCEKYAGTSLDDIFEYIYTTNAIDYQKYFSEAGLTIEFNEITNDQGVKQVSSTIGFSQTPTSLQKTMLNDLFRSNAN